MNDIAVAERNGQTTQSVLTAQQIGQLRLELRQQAEAQEYTAWLNYLRTRAARIALIDAPPLPEHLPAKEG